ncbi:MAG: phosphosulfolactate synthase [Bacteroidota bacterium]|jgi:phosphosulfolactate synthase|nr:MAG: phosphosulfolactate synthase [Bacteroidota bacterium]
MPNMYNFPLSQLPARSEKPRNSGLTMVMDKGLSLREAEDFIEMTAGYVDLIKLGFGTSIISPNLDKKIAFYQEAGIPVYFGGTLFEAFVARNQLNDYVDLLKKYNLKHLEISDGSLDMTQEDKCNYIRRFAQDFIVISEVGSKDAEKIIPPYKWIDMMTKEIEAGVWKVIAEARESGNVGIFRGTGEIRSGLIEEILTRIPQDKIIWEAPQKGQQLWFIKQYGANVSLGNIAPNEVIPLETMRIGLRGDTFHFYLEK